MCQQCVVVITIEVRVGDEATRVQIEGPGFGQWVSYRAELIARHGLYICRETK